MRRYVCVLAAMTTTTAGGIAFADQPLAQLGAWQGSVDFFATGAPLAVDGPDADGTMADQIAQPAGVEVRDTDVPSTARALAAYLYWGGSIVNDDCAGNTIDEHIDFTVPGGVETSIQADACFCSDAGATSYDVQLCRKEVTSMLGSLVGTYVVGGFAAKITNGATDNASFSLVLVYRDGTAKPRRVGLWDGLHTLHDQVNPSVSLTLSGLDVDTPPEGDLTWYALEGDVGGTAGERVVVTGQPSGLSLTLTDALNPADNPMNHTINTTTPPQSALIGVDIDELDISAALAPTDTAVDMSYEAGGDKYWVAYNIVGINIYAPVFGPASSKSWTLALDADQDGEPSPGDTLSYVIALENTGTAPGTVALTDPIAAEASSWALIDAGGGVDASNLTTLDIDSIAVPTATTVEVIFELVIGDVADETVIANQAAFDATPDGDSGTITAPDVLVRRDGDEDGVYDNDDNCPNESNPLQEDANANGVGDACEGGSGGAGGSAAGTGGAGGAAGNGAPSGGAGGAGGAYGGAGTAGSGGEAGAVVPAGGAGGAAPVDDDPATAESEGGCGCRVTTDRTRGAVGTDRHTSIQWLGFVALTLGGALRRRRTRSPAADRG